MSGRRAASSSRRTRGRVVALAAVAAALVAVGWFVAPSWFAPNTAAIADQLSAPSTWTLAADSTTRAAWACSAGHACPSTVRTWHAPADHVTADSVQRLLDDAGWGGTLVGTCQVDAASDVAALRFLDLCTVDTTVHGVPVLLRVTTLGQDATTDEITLYVNR